jgi:hypothetical protein
MSFDDALRRYRAGQFTDEDVTDCTGLSVRSWRELIKVGAVRTITDERGRGRKRACDATTFKRASVISALHREGFSLPTAGRLAYLIPLDHLIYNSSDPITILIDRSRKVDPATGLPPRRKQPLADWFDPNKPAKVDPGNDCLIEIYDARFVGVRYRAQKPVIYGELHDDRTRFTSWYEFQHQGLIHDERLKKIVEIVAKWDCRGEPANRIDETFLDYKYEDHDQTDDPLRITAEATARNPVSTTTVNISFAIRRAIGRYLGIEPEMLIREGDATWDVMAARQRVGANKKSGKRKSVPPHGPGQPIKRPARTIASAPVNHRGNISSSPASPAIPKAPSERHHRLLQT